MDNLTEFTPPQQLFSAVDAAQLATAMGEPDAARDMHRAQKRLRTFYSDAERRRRDVACDEAGPGIPAVPRRSHFIAARFAVVEAEARVADLDPVYSRESELIGAPLELERVQIDGMICGNDGARAVIRSPSPSARGFA